MCGFQCPESKPNQKDRLYRKALDPDGLTETYYATKENPKKKKASFDCPIDTPPAIVNRYEKITF